MVYVIEDLDALEECLRHARYPMYKVVRRQDGRVHVRVKSGKIGFEKVYDSEEDREFKRLMELLRSYDAIEVLTTIPDEQFMA